MNVIEIEGLSKTYRVYQKREGLWASIGGLFRREYREVHAVAGIDLTVEQGEFVAFLGPNGAGKTPDSSAAGHSVPQPRRSPGPERQRALLLRGRPTPSR